MTEHRKIGLGRKTVGRYGRTRGHDIIRTKSGHYLFCDDGAFYCAADATEVPPERERPCRHCGLMPINGRDACLGELPGVINACCGHGVDEAYVEFATGDTFIGAHFHRNPTGGDET